MTVAQPKFRFTRFTNRIVQCVANEFAGRSEQCVCFARSAPWRTLHLMRIAAIVAGNTPSSRARYFAQHTKFCFSFHSSSSSSSYSTLFPQLSVWSTETASGTKILQARAAQHLTLAFEVFLQLNDQALMSGRSSALPKPAQLVHTRVCWTSNGKRWQRVPVCMLVCATSFVAEIGNRGTHWCLWCEWYACMRRAYTCCFAYAFLISVSGVCWSSRAPINFRQFYSAIHPYAAMSGECVFLFFGWIGSQYICRCISKIFYYFVFA